MMFLNVNMVKELDYVVNVLERIVSYASIMYAC